MFFSSILYSFWRSQPHQSKLHPVERVYRHWICYPAVKAVCKTFIGISRCFWLKRTDSTIVWLFCFFKMDCFLWANFIKFRGLPPFSIIMFGRFEPESFFTYIYLISLLSAVPEIHYFHSYLLKHKRVCILKHSSSLIFHFWKLSHPWNLPLKFFCSTVHDFTKRSAVSSAHGWL